MTGQNRGPAESVPEADQEAAAVKGKLEPPASLGLLLVEAAPTAAVTAQVRKLAAFWGRLGGFWGQSGGGQLALRRTHDQARCQKPQGGPSS